jgi:NADPH2:quinone reductase
MEAIGLNFADVYRRRGAYHLAGTPPYIAGYEGAGVVVARGPDARDFACGDRVGFADVPFAHAELVAAPIDKLVPLPTGVSAALAASVLLQGLTAHYLTHDSYAVRSGTTMLVHAAAGGVGQLLVQIGRFLGASVFALASSPEKLEVARTLGADVAWLTSDDWQARARERTAGRGVDVVYDSVGSTLTESLSLARTGGAVVFYGMAGGDPLPVNPRDLMDRSLTLTGGDLWNVLTSAAERRARAATLFEWLEAGKLRAPTVATFPLAEGERAHRLLESRAHAGKILLIP